VAYIRRRGCICEDKKKCKCGAKYSFTVDIGTDPETGKRKQKTESGFKTRKEAIDAAKVVEYEYSQGIFVHEKNINFKDFSAEWLKLYAASGKVRESSVDTRRSCIKRLSKYFDYLPMKDIKRLVYQNMLYDLHAKGFAKETIISTQATGKLIFNKAIELEVIKKNPTDYSVVPVKRKTVEELEVGGGIPPYFEKKELSHFLKTVKNHGTFQDYAQFYTLAFTGLRIGELCVLKKSDVDFSAKTISVTKTLYNNSNNTPNYKLHPPKTNGSERIIEVSDSLLKIIDELRIDQNEYKLSVGDVYHKADFIFVNRKKYPGYPEMQKSIDERMKKFLKLAELNSKFTPHIFRHTHVSLLAEAKVSLEAIMDRLGHQDDKTTRLIYLHVTKSIKREAAQKFDDLMQGL